MRTLTFTSPVQMQDIAAPCIHELLEFRLALLMYQRQINNKSLAKITNGSLGYANVFFIEFALDLLAVATTQKQCLSHIHHDIVAVPGAARYQLV